MKRVLLTAILILLIASNIMAFNGERRGFLLGFGMGPGLMPLNGGNKIVLFNSDFRIGHGFSDKFQLYLSAKTAWAKDEYCNQMKIFGIGGIGMSYYCSKSNLLVYITSSVGLTLMNTTIGPEFRPGLSFGIGYEFSKHWSLEGTFICQSTTSHTFYERDIYPVLCYKLTLNTLAY